MMSRTDTVPVAGHGGCWRVGPRRSSPPLPPPLFALSSCPFLPTGDCGRAVSSAGSPCCGENTPAQHPRGADAAIFGYRRSTRGRGKALSVMPLAISAGRPGRDGRDAKTIKVNILRSTTRFQLGLLVNVTNLLTGVTYAAETFSYSGSKYNESEHSRPEYPSAYPLKDSALRSAIADISKLLFPWAEVKQITFFNSVKQTCNLKLAHLALVSGDNERALELSEENIELCNSEPRAGKTIRSNAYFNAGVTYRVSGEFDTVVVDEGQDLHELWWTSLEAVFRSPGGDNCYYVFYDPKQNLFVDDPALPEELGRPFELPVNCRNTVRIAAHCATLAGYKNQVLDGAPLGDEPAVIRTRGMQDAFHQAKLRVLQLCQSGQGGLARS